MLRGAAVLPAAVLLLAACGSATKPCTSPAAARAIVRLRADTRAIRAAANLPVKNALKGNAAVSAATDKFLRDVELAPIDNIARNRYIDLAAAALVGSCEQCFQALEAERPIVQIAHNPHSGNCQK